jgi:hypothetical protein
MKLVRVATVAAAGLLLTACQTAAEQTGMTPLITSAPPTCTETAATPAAGRPDMLATTTGSWYGATDLWVGLPEHPATVEGDALVLKFPWVTLDGDEPTSELGAPQVSASSTDTPAPIPATFADYARTFGTGDLAFWPATIKFPSAGCWTVTGQLAETTVQFTVEVAAP